jgi:hypothetical protein
VLVLLVLPVLLDGAWGCRETGFVLTALRSDAGSADATVFNDMGVTPGGCDQYTPGSELGLCAATYLGGAGEDRTDGVAFDADGNVLIAARLSEPPFGLSPRELGDGQAGVLRLYPTGRAPLSWTQVASRIRDLSVGGDPAQIALATEDGVAVLDANARELLWRFDVEGGALRVDSGTDGSVVALLPDGTVNLLGADGAPLVAFGVEAERVLDVALDTATDSVFVVGARLDADGCDGPTPMLRSYGFNGRVQWRRFDFADADGHCDDAEGVRVTVGRDGLLYYAGQSGGPDSAHGRDPQDATVPGPIVGGDVYASPEAADGPVGFVARFDPGSGQMDRGQWLVPRDGERGQRLLITGLDADAGGHVFVSGEAGCCIEQRDALRLSGQRPGDYDGGDLFVAVLSPDLEQRLSWFTLSGSPGSAATASGVAVGGRFAAVVANQPGSDGALITTAALAPEPAGETEGYVAIWPAPGGE